MEVKRDEGAPAEPVVDEQEGFNIDLTWLSDSQKDLKWTDETMLSFLAGSPYKVSGKTVIEALNKLTREQAEVFTREINNRREKHTNLF